MDTLGGFTELTYALGGFTELTDALGGFTELTDALVVFSVCDEAADAGITHPRSRTGRTLSSTRAL